MKRSTFSISQPADSPQIPEPLLRLIRHSDPRDLADSPSLSMTVERFQKRFIQRLTNNLHIAEAVIHDALAAEGYSEPAAHAEVARFAHQLSRALQAFAEEADSNAAVAEEIDQAKTGLASVQPIQPGGRA